MLVTIRLMRKLADRINGIDLTGRAVGDVFEVPAAAADLLIAERWAMLVEPSGADGQLPSGLGRSRRVTTR